MVPFSSEHTVVANMWNRYQHWLLNGSLIGLMVWWAYWVVQPLPFYPTGVDWTQYIMGAEYIWRWSPELIYPDWRHPLYSYLLGLCAVDSYAHSARVLNSIGMAFGGLSSVYAGYSIRRPWFGVIAAVIWLCHPLVLDARDWINPYMLWGGTLSVVGVCGWRLSKSNGKVLSWMTIIFGALSLWLDGRSVFILAMIVVWCVMHRRWRSGIHLVSGWTVAIFLERQLLDRYGIELKGLFEQLELQRAFLFREGMGFQLFPSPSNASVITDLCSSAAPAITALHLDCTFAMFKGNMTTWMEWGLLPPLVIVLSVFGVLAVQCRRYCVLLSVLVLPMLMSGLVWQPPRYLFWTLWFWSAAMGASLMVLAEHERLRWIAPIFLGSIGWWLWTAPILNSIDQPRDWATTGRLIAEQVGDVTLDCTGEGLVLGRLSSKRARDWSVLPDTQTCQQWMEAGVTTEWGVNTVLTTTTFPASKGWVLETGFDLDSGVVYLYRH